MNTPLVFMFSGQGSQYYQMGKGCYQKEPAFRKILDRLDTAAESAIGESVLKYIYAEEKHPADVFDRLLFSHPAIFMVEYALARFLMEKGLKPDCLLGASLGEFTAAAVADALSYQEAIPALVEQARLFEKHGKPGGMLAVLANVRLYHDTAILHRNSDLAAVHFDSHFVISGNNLHLTQIEQYLQGNRIVFQRLPVLYGFHSREIDPIEFRLKEIHAGISYARPRISLLSCARGQTVTNIDADYLWQVVREPIRFQDTLKRFPFGHNAVFVDLGPSGTLATFLKYSLKPDQQANVFSVFSPRGSEIDNLVDVLDRIPPQSRVFHIKENKMQAFVFPGQGSQRKGMGDTLFEEYKAITEQADRILGYSIRELCLRDSEGRLGHTQYTQPAIYVVNALSFMKQVERSGVKPDYVAGHSLGEYNALLAACVFDFETGLRLVQKRGELMSRARGGGMAAVVGLRRKDVEAVIQENSLQDISVANYNTPSQTVVAGPRESIAKAEPFFMAKGAAVYIPLNVSGAFHTPCMEPAEQEFRDFIEAFRFSIPQIPVVSNVHARPYDSRNLKETLVAQITRPVQWTDSIRYLMGKGVTEFLEIGTGSVLTDLIRKIRAEAGPLSVEDEAPEPFPPSPIGSEPDASGEAPVFPVEWANPETPALPPQSPVPVGAEGRKKITAESLGSLEFKKTFHLKYAYVTGGMYVGIASQELVSCIAKGGMLGFFGTGGLDAAAVEKAVVGLKNELNGHAYGMNLLSNSMEDVFVDLFLKHGIRNIEAAAYIQITPALVKYRLKGLRKGASGAVVAENRILAKLSRPEVAANFLSPAPDELVRKLLNGGEITAEQAALSRRVPMADHLCAEADSGGHTDQQVAYALLPAIRKLRDEMTARYQYAQPVCVGAAGGIGTPEAAAAAFVLGADFVLTGSINQCTVESGASDAVKDLLQEINVQDTDYAPAGDMFELGSKVQVLRKGVFFPARANKLYALYRQHNSLDEIDAATRTQLQDRYFKRSFSEIYEDVKAYYPKEEIEKAEINPKHKMALVFRWYFGLSSRLALTGDRDRQVDFQVHCGPALGAFNQWVKGTELESWRNRHVDEIAEKIMNETADYLNRWFDGFMSN